MPLTPQEIEMISNMSSILMQPLMTPTLSQNMKYVECVVQTALAIYAELNSAIKGK